MKTRALQEICSAYSFAAENGSFPRELRERLTEMGLEVFKSLWQLDFFAMGLS